MEQRIEIQPGDDMHHRHLDPTLMEATEVDEAGQEMVLNKKNPRRASKKHLRDRKRIIFSQRKPEGVRELEEEAGDSRPKGSFKKDREIDWFEMLRVPIT